MNKTAFMIETFINGYWVPQRGRVFDDRNEASKAAQDLMSGEHFRRAGYEGTVKTSIKDARVVPWKSA